MSPSPALQRIHKAAMQLFAERGATQVSVSELAAAAGVARGTIYNNLEQPDDLFNSVAAGLVEEMEARLALIVTEVEDPAHRLSIGVRAWIRRAHEEPHWGRFLTRFSFGNTALQAMWIRTPVQDLGDGVISGRYRVRPEQLPSLVAMLAGTVIGAIFLVLEGHRTWRDAGSDTVEFLLVAMGLPREEARQLATVELPVLPAGPE